MRRHEPTHEAWVVQLNWKPPEYFKPARPGGSSTPTGSPLEPGHEKGLEPIAVTAPRVDTCVPAASSRPHLSGTVLPARALLRAGSLSTGGLKPSKAKTTRYVIVRWDVLPERSVACTVS